MDRDQSPKKAPDAKTGDAAIENAGKPTDKEVKGPNFTGSTKEFVRGAVSAGHPDEAGSEPKAK
jgi:hypothetical protein